MNSEVAQAKNTFKEPVSQSTSQSASRSGPPQYLWALGQGTNKIPLGTLVDDRYEVIAPSIWLDTQSHLVPKVPASVPDFALPYLKAHPYQLNLPGVYGICHQASGEAVLLLSNVPVSQGGQLMPSIAEAWSEASAFYQAYWLWQMISLWEPLKSFGVAASLLKKTNLRIDAWRVRMIGLSASPSDPSLAKLAKVWERTFLPDAQPEVAQLLEAVCPDLRKKEPDLQAIREQVNALLLQTAAGRTMELQVAGGTSSGPSQMHNEDACYPSQRELRRAETADLPLLPRLAIVCDGVGGHEGGEVASQRVVRSLQLQMRSLLSEAMEQNRPMPPRVVVDQIEAAIRVANNLIAQQNDEQGRADRRRMGTTLVMALVLPQRIETPEGPVEVNELYLTHIGDSRAYWITSEYCHQLTIDDDVAGHEVTEGLSFYATASRRPHANALSQAVGVREFERLHPHTQRFLFTTSGALLLCSDGLSDHHQVETSWQNYISLIVNKIVPLGAAVDSWIELANQKNGHDNVAVALMSVNILNEVTDNLGQSQQTTEAVAAVNGEGAVRGTVINGGAIAIPGSSELTAAANEEEMTAASRALLYGEDEDDDTPLTQAEIEAVTMEPSASSRSRGQRLVTSLLALVILGVVGVVGILLWRQVTSPEPSELLPSEQGAIEDNVWAENVVQR
ncbi:MAG: protein phosphatase 2C domain-containing protein [Cyanobacteria bacterium P01_D01_bin.105]